jgi:guanine deaminase
MNRSTSRFTCEAVPDPDRRAFFTHTAMAAAAGVAAAAGLHAVPAKGATAATTPTADQRKYMEEATRLAAADRLPGVSRRGHGDHRCSGKLNPKGLLGTDYGAGTILEMIPREPNSPDLVPMRARMLKGCDIYINGAPCPMCMSAIYWSRIDRVFFGNSLKDTSAIGFDDAFQYEDFAKPWSQRHIPIAENFERDMTMKSYKAWMDKEDRHPY